MAKLEKPILTVAQSIRHTLDWDWCAFVGHTAIEWGSPPDRKTSLIVGADLIGRAILWRHGVRSPIVPRSLQSRILAYDLRNKQNRRWPILVVWLDEYIRPTLLPKLIGAIISPGVTPLAFQTYKSVLISMGFDICRLHLTHTKATKRVRRVLPAFRYIEDQFETAERDPDCAP